MDVEKSRALRVVGFGGFLISPELSTSYRTDARGIYVLVASDMRNKDLAS
jgi:hypothetical protein